MLNDGVTRRRRRYEKIKNHSIMGDNPACNLVCRHIARNSKRSRIRRNLYGIYLLRRHNGNGRNGASRSASRSYNDYA